MRIKQVPVKRGRVEIIPMIDVVFFMLVFSMLSSLALAAISTPKVNVPAASNAEKGAPARVFVTLTKDKKLYVNEKNIAVDQLTDELRKEVDKNPEAFVIINCDQDNQWGEFRALMAATYKADPKNVAIMTHTKSTAPKA